MAFPIEQLLRGFDQANATRVAQWCENSGFTQAVQLGYLDTEDIAELAPAMGVDSTVLEAICAKAKDAAEGWTTSVV